MNQPRNRRLLLLLGVVLVAFAASLPWQQRQWRTLAAEREKTRLQETRIAELRGSGGTGPAPSDAPAVKGGPAERLVALQTRAARGDAASVLPELERLAAESLTPAERAGLSGVYQTLDYSDRAYEEARRAAEDAKRSGTESPEVLLRLGYLEMLFGYSQSGLDRFRRAAELAPADAPPHVAIALVYDQKQEYPAAEAALREALERDAGNVQTRLLLVKNLAAQEKYGAALAELDALEKQAPTLPALPLQRADILLSQAGQSPGGKAGRLEQADDALARCLSLDPNNEDARFLKGRVARERGDDAGARRAWEALYAVRPEYPTLAFALGQLYNRAGERAKAVPLLRAYRERKERDERYQDLVRASGMAPDDNEKRRELARWSAENGRLSRAILEYGRILERKPDDADAKRERQRLIAEREKTSGRRPGA